MRVLQLVGSAESDFLCDLSRLYAGGALEVIGGDVAYVTPDGAWRFPDDLSAAAIEHAPPHAPAAAIGHVLGLGVDVMVPQMFCRPGMTHYRALFDVLGIPYVGNPPEVMALGTDKAKARAVVAAAGGAVPEGEVVRPGEPVSLAPPVIVKPVDGDNSHGVTLVTAAEDLDAAVADACAHGSAALIERYVPPGREVRCATLERGGELVVLPLEEYPVGEGHPIRSAEDKLSGSGADLKLVAKTAEHAWIVAAGDPVEAAVGEAARLAHRALGCRHYGLFDFRVDDAGTPWFLEAGLYCSFAEASVVATMARAAGIGTAELFSICVEEALS